MNAEFAKPRTPLHAGGGSGGGVAAAARVDDQHWGASDQASRLRALVEAVARGTTAEPVFDEPESGTEAARGVAFRAAPGVGRDGGHAARRDADAGSRVPQPREIVATVEAGPARAARPTVPVIAIASGKGGVGKTSIAVNLAIALNQRGCRASLLDADLGLANADVLCGIVPTSRLDLVVEDQTRRRSPSTIRCSTTRRRRGR
ncbi:MAG: P-loop NTPase [Phycisphaerales bacterium]